MRDECETLREAKVYRQLGQSAVQHNMGHKSGKQDFKVPF